MKYTENKKLKLPEYSDAVNIEDINSNFETIDKSLDELQTTSNAKADINHASDDTIYGIGTDANYGHARIVNNLTQDSNLLGTALSAYQGKVLKDLIEAAQETADKALEIANTERDLHEIFGDTLPDETLTNNSPSVIQKVAKYGMGANFWSVGDMVWFDNIEGVLGTNTDCGVFKFSWYAFIIGFNHNSSIEGGNSIHFQFGKRSNGVDTALVSSYGDNYSSSSRSTTYFYMNVASSSTNTNRGGWGGSYLGGSAMRTICGNFFNALPSAWRNIITYCNKYTDNTGGGTDDPSYVTATMDKVWLLSEFEVFGERKYANSAEQNYQQQYDYYKNGNNRVKYKEGSTDTNTAILWWLRSAVSIYESSYCLVNEYGNSGTGLSRASYGFAPGFKVS